MLRDLPPFVQHDATVFMNSPREHEEDAQDGHQTRQDPLDDVFGSAPSSPTLSPSINHDQRDSSNGGERGNTEHSDVPRLRRIHVTNGYREGIAVSKEEHVQAGFDEGFSLGGEIGMRAGWCLGVLEAVYQALARGKAGNDEAVKRAREMHEQAKAELVLEKLLGEAHFGPDGIWKYDVPGQDDVEELDVTFADVAVQHPVLKSLEWSYVTGVKNEILMAHFLFVEVAAVEGAQLRDESSPKLDRSLVNERTADKVEHWLESTTPDMDSMRELDRERDTAPSTSSSSPARPGSLRNNFASVAGRKPRRSRRGGSNTRGSSRGRGQRMSTFHLLLPPPQETADTQGSMPSLERTVTPLDRSIAMPPHVKKMTPPMLPRSPTRSTSRALTPTGRAAGSPTPRRYGNIISPRTPQSIRRVSSRSLRNPFELAINVADLPRCYTTWMVYQLFEQYGNINYIRIDRTPGKAFVVFRPAPKDISWVGSRNSGAYLDIEGNQRHFKWQAWERNKPTPMYTSPDGANTYPEQIMLPLVSIDFGTMKNEHLMNIMSSISGPTDENASLSLDLKKKRVLLNFDIGMPAIGDCPPVTRKFMIELDIAQMHKMILVHGTDKYVSVVITILHPPEVHRKASNIKETHGDLNDTDGAVKNDEWNEYNAWYRQTDIDADPAGRKGPVQLRKTTCILDTGRWLTYRMRFSPSVASSDFFKHFCQGLADHNIRADLEKDLEYVHSDLDTSWRWADSLQKVLDPSKPTSFLADLLQMTDTIHLTFSVHYQLEVCISRGVIHECNMHVGFLSRLAALDPVRAVKILEKVADRKERMYDPEDIFLLHNQVSVVEKQRPGYCAKIPSATVTPTTVYFSTPVLETSNRVVRNFAQYEDRFLRVKFNDERHKGGLHSQDHRVMDEIFSRVFRVMTNGIIVGGRHYEFLAFGSSQFREHGAYFFASTDTLSAARIRDWMGDFTRFNNVAKYISRLGLCFTTTRGIPHKVNVQRIDDVVRNGYEFTDGVGKISTLLADMIAGHYKLDYRPSVFQFRMAGCKGVLAVDPDVKGMSVQIRPSQEKFPAAYYGLEVAKVSKFTSANLNVQLILVLSALGISDGVFMDKLRIMLADMEKAMTDEAMARRLLEKNIDYSQMTLSLSQAIGDGFMETQEPFIISWLHLWRSWALKYLKLKQRILVEQGAYVFGVTDETGTLKGYFDDGGKAFDRERKAKGLETLNTFDDKRASSNREPADISIPKPLNFGFELSKDEKLDKFNDKSADGSPPLPEVFIQVPDPEAKGGYTVIEAICILTRSPTLHPGDVRVVRAVNVPALHHLKDCVVLPQTGDRDLANMCSGGDLDGDEYIVSWDPELIPHESKWNLPAMDFSTAKPPPREGPVSVKDMASFFVNHIKNDKLGQIAVAHKCWADMMQDGVQNENCIELAGLHSQAVDYPKTGMPAKFPRRLRPSRRPHWSEPRGASYFSRRVIGQLYNAVKLDNFKPAWELPFDQRILSACVPSQQNLEDAKEVKDLYDESMRRIMAQYGIKNEFEVFTTFVQEHNSEINDFKFAETIDEVSSSLRSQFMEQCYEKAGTTSKERDWEKMKPFIVAMYTVTANEVGDAVAESKQMVERGGREEPRRVLSFDNVPFMSFPWIFARDLASIAKGRNGNMSLAYQTAKARPTLPTDKKLAKFQAMAELYGELEPLKEAMAEVSMPEGRILHAGDVMNLHHNKRRVTSVVEKAGIEGSSSGGGQLPAGGDLSLTFSLLSSMEKGVVQKSAKQMCQENAVEVTFTAGDPFDADLQLKTDSKVAENVPGLPENDVGVPSDGGTTTAEGQLAAIDVEHALESRADVTMDYGEYPACGSPSIGDFETKDDTAVGVEATSDQQQLISIDDTPIDVRQPAAVDMEAGGVASGDGSEIDEEEVEIVFDEVPSNSMDV